MFRTPLFASCVFAGCVSAVLGTAPAGAQVAIDWVDVRNPGNAPDPTTGFGSVGYLYRIGATEVTNEQYAAFLNAVAASDPNGLYNTSMGSDPRGGVTRSGTDGSYTYETKPNMGNKPVNYVSWYDAARMANWLTNGQPTGVSAGTESGVYTLTGPTSISAITRDLSDTDQVFIPTENEWYKAAYHQPASQGGDADSYWRYATRSNIVPTLAAATTVGDIANPGPNTANYNRGADWNGQNGNVTSVGSAGESNFYGTFDMNGNVDEWNQTESGLLRVIRGGSWVDSSSSMRSEVGVNSNNPLLESVNVGFRIASPVPPCSVADTNADGVLSPADFNAWVLAFNAQSPACDQNGDGFCTPADFNVWVLNFNAGCD